MQLLVPFLSLRGEISDIVLQARLCQAKVFDPM